MKSTPHIFFESDYGTICLQGRIKDIMEESVANSCGDRRFRGVKERTAIAHRRIKQLERIVNQLAEFCYENKLNMPVIKA